MHFQLCLIRRRRNCRIYSINIGFINFQRKKIDVLCKTDESVACFKQWRSEILRRPKIAEFCSNVGTGQKIERSKTQMFVQMNLSILRNADWYKFGTPR